MSKTEELHWLLRWLDRYAEGIGFKVTVFYVILFVIVTILFTITKIELVGVPKTAYHISFTFFIASLWLSIIGWIWRENR